MLNWKTLFTDLGNYFRDRTHRPSGKRRPTGAALRNPADPTQAARIEAAAAKRERRAVSRIAAACRSVMNNPTVVGWKGPFPDYQCRDNLNPFYIAK